MVLSEVIASFFIVFAGVGASGQNGFCHQATRLESGSGPKCEGAPDSGYTRCRDMHVSKSGSLCCSKFI